MNQSQTEWPYRLQGLHYGYPKCCVEYWQDKDLTGPTDKAERDLGFTGTGYRPCLQCTGRTMQSIYNEIAQRRLEVLPFPVSPEEMDPTQPREQKIIRYSQLLNFRKRMRKIKLGKAFDYREHEPELELCITEIHRQINGEKVEKKFRAQVSEGCDTLVSRSLYLVHGERGFTTAQDRFRNSIQPIRRGGDRIYMVGNFPKAYPSVVQIVMLDTFIQPEGYDEPLRQAQISCWTVENWLADLTNTHADQIRELTGSIEERTRELQAMPAEKARMPNMEKLEQGYLVRTQAGYRKAMRDFLKHRGWEPSNGGWYDAREHYGIYPAIINFRMSGDSLNHHWRDMIELRRESAEIEELRRRLAACYP